MGIFIYLCIFCLKIFGYCDFTRIFIDKNYIGGELIKYPCGITLLQLPFLFISLLLSKIFNMDLENGYSVLFDRSVLISGDFYCILVFILCSVSLNLIWIDAVRHGYINSNIASVDMLRNALKNQYHNLINR